MAAKCWKINRWEGRSELGQWIREINTVTNIAQQVILDSNKCLFQKSEKRGFSMFSPQKMINV